MRKINKGFTLVEFLIVITIIVILAGTIFVAVNPARRFTEARNSVRHSDVILILNAILEYRVNNRGASLDTIDALAVDLYYQIGTDSDECSKVCAGEITQAVCCDLSGLVDAYIIEIPKDPQTGTDAQTDYYIFKSATGRITIGACAPEAENGDIPIIRITR